MQDNTRRATVEYTRSKRRTSGPCRATQATQPLVPVARRTSVSCALSARSLTCVIPRRAKNTKRTHQRLTVLVEADYDWRSNRPSQSSHACWVGGPAEATIPLSPRLIRNFSAGILRIVRRYTTAYAEQQSLCSLCIWVGWCDSSSLSKLSHPHCGS